MAAVYGVIKNHGGSIFVDSELGKGTEVRIYLPAIDKEEEKISEPESVITSGIGTILIIDDEDIVMDVVRAMLEKLGYRVLEAKTGKEAINIAENFDEDIDLALLDIKLPDMDGGRVHSLIREVRPDLKVIVCSGYSLDGPAQEILKAGGQDFMQKPFSISVLSRKLNDLLGAR